LSARINNFEGLTFDSIPLFNDGLHNDALANDQVWGNQWQPGSAEQNYYIDLLTFDSTDKTRIDLTKATRITTAGPVAVDSIAYAKGTGNYFSIIPYLHNSGKIMTIKNITVKVIVDDPWLTYINNNLILFPEISPGSTESSSSLCNIGYIDSIFPGYFNMKFEIMSDGWVYWTDSTRLVIPVVGIDEQTNKPLTFKLEQNYPNPFNPATSIQYSIASRQFVELKIFNVLGQEIETLVNAEKPAGNYQVEFNAANLPSGVYFYRIQAGSFNQVRKMLLIK
jgi:hypothetical protein